MGSNDLGVYAVAHDLFDVDHVFFLDFFLFVFFFVADFEHCYVLYGIADDDVISIKRNTRRQILHRIRKRLLPQRLPLLIMLIKDVEHDHKIRKPLMHRRHQSPHKRRQTSNRPLKILHQTILQPLLLRGVGSGNLVNA